MAEELAVELQAAAEHAAADPSVMQDLITTQPVRSAWQKNAKSANVMLLGITLPHNRSSFLVIRGLQPITRWACRKRLEPQLEPIHRGNMAFCLLANEAWCELPHQGKPSFQPGGAGGHSPMDESGSADQPLTATAAGGQLPASSGDPEGDV